MPCLSGGQTPEATLSSELGFGQVLGTCDLHVLCVGSFSLAQELEVLTDWREHLQCRSRTHLKLLPLDI